MATYKKRRRYRRACVAGLPALIIGHVGPGPEPSAECLQAALDQGGCTVTFPGGGEVVLPPGAARVEEVP